MRVRSCNPRHMSEAARLAELGALLARAYRRLVAQNRANQLAESAEAERSSGSAGEARATTKGVA
jgi:hypothetical protein